MNYRNLGRTGWKVSDISFGAWAIGGSWGSVDDTESLAALNAAIDCGVNFIDTADVYGMGRSERLIAQLKRDRKEEIIVATKAGRRLSPHTADGYNERNLTGFIEDSLRNLATDCLDLVQLHCPPTDVYYRPELFGALDRLVEAGKLRYYGVSVERVEEALKAIEYPNVQTVQIIFNCFRQRPADLFFEQAKRRQVGILARVPLASGLLSGKLTRDSQFAADDHRQFNRHGEAFRRRRNLLRRGLRNRSRRRRRTAQPAARGGQYGAIRAALDFDARCRDLRHPGRQAALAGAGQLRGERSAGAFRCGDGRDSRHLRCEDPRFGPPALVNRGYSKRFVKNRWRKRRKIAVLTDESVCPTLVRKGLRFCGAGAFAQCHLVCPSQHSALVVGRAILPAAAFQAALSGHAFPAGAG